MKELFTRIGTALLAASVLIISVIAGRYTFLAFFFILAMVCLNEFYSLSAKKEIRVSRITGMFSGAILYLTTALYLHGSVHLKFFFFLIIPGYIVFITALTRKHITPFTDIAFTLTGILYTVLPVCLLISMGFLSKNHQYNYQPPLGFLFLLWANDTGAYFSGRAFGKNRLLERVSPKKTWEGFIGGFLTALITGTFISRYYVKLNLIEWLGMTIIVVVFGTLGDLVESLYKRELDMKDSGSILPGHGGVLDRFDGMLLSAPFVFLYLLLLGL